MRLYHLVPQGGVVGDELMPLSQLRVELPEVYEAARQKYEGRERVPQNYVPLLDRYWRDMVFLSPVHPQAIHDVLVSCGHLGLVGRKAFVVDPSLLDPSQLVVYEFEGGGGYDYYNREYHSRYERIGERTRISYREALVEGKQPFIFAGITHVLYCGRIPIAGLPVVEVRQ